MVFSRLFRWYSQPEVSPARSPERKVISNVGNRQVEDMAVGAGCWLCSDSLIMDEPTQIEELGHRPAWLATIIEDGEDRHYVLRDDGAEEKECLSKLPPSTLVFVGNDNETIRTDGRVKIGRNLDAGEPHAGQIRQASVILPKGMNRQQVTLRAELEVNGVRRPVRWPCRQSTNPDGGLTIRRKKGRDPYWRKGV